MIKVSAIINVISEEVAYLPRVLPSIAPLVDEIVIIDMTDDDPNLAGVAEKYNATIYSHKFEPYVELVRNYGLSKAKGEWILIMDPDEELSKELLEKLKKLVDTPKADYYRIPRKNIIFGKWMQHGRMWPDYNIRFFKRGCVMWDEIVHAVPITKGVGLDLKPKEEYAITHHHYHSIDQFLTRMHRYTSIQARDIALDKKYKFIWMDVIRRPMGEFLSRYFAGEGYKDGLHGLAFSLLQAFSEVIKFLKVWEREKFLEQFTTPSEIAREFGVVQAETNWWVSDMLIKDRGYIKSLPIKIKRKILSKVGELRQKQK